jgi:hypothetical protein
MRSGLDANASYLHVQHERGRMRYGGGAHVHADSLSFIVAARGSDLAMGPGYIDCANHAMVKYGTDHNIVLVDGQGPPFIFDGIIDGAPSSDAFLHDHEVAPPFATLVASTRYGGVELRRRVVRITTGSGDDVFVVADRMLADAEHAYTFQLNGLASEEIANSAFEISPSEDGAAATWRRASAALHALVTATAPGVVSADSRLEESALASGRHRCLELSATMDGGAGFVTLLVPSAPEDTPQWSQRRVAGSHAVATVTLADGHANRAYLGAGAGTVDVYELAAPPGLTVVLESPDGSRATRHWTMDTPSIPEEDELP